MKKSDPHSRTNILVDFFCFTVEQSEFFDGFTGNFEEDVDVVQYMNNALLGAPVEFELRRGFNGYEKAYFYDGITFCFGGNGGIFVNMSGSGCRTWETLHTVFSWEDFISDLSGKYKSFHISRMDIACDTFDLLRLRYIQNYTSNEKFISRWNDYLIMHGNKQDEVIYGSPKSIFRCRIYDKTMERLHKLGAKTEDIPKNWVRIEFQLRNEAAASFVREWQRNNSIGATFFGILNNQLLFYQEYDGKNRDRAVVPRWWSSLLKDAEKLKLAYCGGKEYNFDTLHYYLSKQAGSSMRALVDIHDGDLSALAECFSGSNLNTRQKQLVKEQKEYRQQQREKFEKEQVQAAIQYNDMLDEYKRVMSGL